MKIGLEIIPLKEKMEFAQLRHFERIVILGGGHLKLVWEIRSQGNNLKGRPQYICVERVLNTCIEGKRNCTERKRIYSCRLREVEKSL